MVKESRRLFNQYLQIQESAQQRFNNCRGVELRATRYGDSQQNLSHYWSDSKDGNRQPSGASVEALAASVKGGGNGTYTAVSPCVFCRGQHFNNECDKYKELNDRKKQLLSQGRCFLCLKPGNMFRDCTFSQKMVVTIVENSDITIWLFVQRNLGL